MDLKGTSQNTLELVCPRCEGWQSNEIKFVLDDQSDNLTCKCSCGHEWIVKIYPIFREPPKASAWIEEDAQTGEEILYVGISRWDRGQQCSHRVILKMANSILHPTKEGDAGRVIKIEDINENNSTV